MGGSNYNTGEAGIIFRKFGVTPKEAVVGMHFSIPWIDEIRIVDMTCRPQTITLQCFLQNLQSVTVTVRILYRPDVSLLLEMTRKLGGFDYYTEVTKFYYYYFYFERYTNIIFIRSFFFVFVVR